LAFSPNLGVGKKEKGSKKEKGIIIATGNIFPLPPPPQKKNE
jgi:hypothetical protein